MHIPIVIAAFGTTSTASTTYEFLNEKIKNRFPDHDLHWAYSSRMIKNLSKKNGATPKHPHQILRRLYKEGHKWAVVQSLHLTAGYEFYRLLDEVSHESIRASLGLPLLYSPQDFYRLGSCLAPDIDTHPQKAIILIGHGTDHHAWTTYPALQTILRKRFGERIYIGVAEEYPPRKETVAEVVASGHRQVYMIPLLLVAGMHFQQDVTGDAADSWQSLFEKKGIDVETSPQGLGLLPGVSDIVCEHIQEAIDVMPAGL